MRSSRRRRRTDSCRWPPALVKGSSAGALLLFASCSSCGYHALYAAAPASRLHVKVVRTLVPDAVASDEVAAGARDELARAGMLESGDGFPRAEIEVLRADETSQGIQAVAGEAVARGTDVALVARAWVVQARGSTPEDDTGDLSAEEVIAVDETNGVRDPRASTFHATDGLRAAARRLGRKLARRLMGAPAAGEDTRGTSDP
jgi:hypothetical protein